MINPIDYIPEGSYLTYIKIVKKGKWVGKKSIQKATALYICKCGKVDEYYITSVKTGHRQSCGCKIKDRTPTNIKHGFSNHPLYWVWSSMKLRCYNKKNQSYIHYGGRGVKICKEWKTNPKTFIDWALNNGWQPGLKLDKDIKPKELGIEPLLYSPEMCQFVTSSDNCSSRRSNRIIEYNGKTQTLNQWAIELGIKRETIAKRIDKLGYPIEKALLKVDRRISKRKSIIQIDIHTGERIEIFDSIIMAANKTTLNYSSISAALRGRMKTAGGFKWKYA
jgi:hypothetical protein